MALRFGEDVSNKDIDDITIMIKKGFTIFVEQQSRRVVVHQVTFRGKEINVVYDKERKVPITALFDEDEYQEMTYGKE